MAATESQRKRQRTYSSSAPSSEVIASAASAAAAAIKKDAAQGDAPPSASSNAATTTSTNGVKPGKSGSQDYPGSHAALPPQTTTTAAAGGSTSSSSASVAPGSSTSAESKAPVDDSSASKPDAGAGAGADAEGKSPFDYARPVTGSDEWHSQRRLNHKEVERRRRKNISDGINELQDLLPTPDANKAQIIRRAVEYIKRLKETETNNIEKWTLEKLISDQAVNELSNSNDKLKIELEKAYIEIEHWKKNYNALIKQQHKDE